MALGHEHGGGVMGWQPVDLERAACSSHADKERAGVHNVEHVAEVAPTEDLNILLARGASDQVPVNVECANEKLDPAVVHLGADKDDLGGVGVEVSEPPGTLNTPCLAVEAAVALWEALRVVHSEDAVQLYCGNTGRGNAAARLAAPELPVDGIFQPRDGASLSGGSTQTCGGSSAVGSAHVDLQTSVMVLEDAGLRVRDTPGYLNRILRVMPQGAVRVADVVHASSCLRQRSHETSCRTRRSSGGEFWGYNPSCWCGRTPHPISRGW